jgi:tetratricopeptide (TPR) repeat protein
MPVQFLNGSCAGILFAAVRQNEGSLYVNAGKICTVGFSIFTYFPFCGKVFAEREVMTVKALRFILPGLVILAAAGLLVYQGFVEKNLETRDLIRGIIIILGSIGTMFKKPKQRPVSNKKALYQKAYPEFIQEPFAEEPKLESKFYDAVHDYNRNKPAAAIAKLEKLRGECQRTSDLRAVTVFLALCLDDMGRYPEALEKYDAARKLRDSSTLASNMGLCAYRLGNFNQALDYYEEAIQLDKSNACAYSNLATLYFAAGDYESALGAAEDALSCNEKMPQALSVAAICANLIGDEAGYTAYYRRAVAAGYDGDKIKRVIKQMNSDL